MESLSREYLEFLVEKRLSGTISPKERELLDQWINQEPEGQMIWLSDDEDEKAFRERLLKRIKKNAGIRDDEIGTKGMSTLRRYRRQAAAAVLLLIGGSLAYVLLTRTNINPVGRFSQKLTIQDAPPGYQGAVLTLANGDKILLDSTGNGKVAIQGHSLLVNNSGQLAYEEATGSAASSSMAHADGKQIFNTLETPRGREFRIVLSDGSKVWLNAASSITYPTSFTGERKVTVTGEAYFEIAQDSRHPFVVSVGDAKVTVLGTHFDLMAYGDEKLVRTTLLEGAVRVSHGHKQVVIAPGQQASFSMQSEGIDVAVVDAKQAVAWIDGKLSLDNLDVETIMKKISRWYDVDVVFDGTPSDHRYWGVINRDVNLSDMLKVMKATGINASFKNNKIIVTSDH